jgi:Ser/Thr protein kinase RdoA (MazF antagonist)
LIDSEYALSLARKHLPDVAAVTGISESGLRNVAFEMDGNYILKVRRPSAPDGEMARGVAVMRHIRAFSDVPVPLIIALDEDPDVGVYSLMTRISGVSLREKGRPRSHAAINAAGQVAARLHAVPIEPLRGSGDVPDLDVEAFWRLGLGWLRERHHLDADAEAILERRYQHGREQFASFRPVLLHGDLWPGSFYFAADSDELAGLIDFGDASFGPAAWEFSLNQLERGEWPDELHGAYVKVAAVEPIFEAEVEFYRMVNTVRFLAWMEPWAPEASRPTVYHNVLEAIRRYVSEGSG